MNWYNGDIAQAVAESRSKNAIFVVYVAGKDANTEKLTKMINEDKIRAKLESENFVAIRVESDSQSYLQFASIYQMVPVPSIFFIGKSGTPIEIGTGIMQNVDELDDKINRALEAQGLTPSSSSTSFINAEKEAGADAVVVERPTSNTKEATTNETIKEAVAVAEAETAADSEIVCEDGVCYKKPKESPKTTTSEAVENDNSEQSGTNNEPPTDQLEATRKLLEQKRRERIEKERETEKDQELRRRREGKEMQHLQNWQREQELKELKANIRRERMEEQAARERIRAQIAADRAERAQRFNVPTTPDLAAVQQKDTTPKPVNNAGAVADNVRLQFRLSFGEAQAHTFNTRDTIAVVRDYVKNELLTGSGVRDFTLATAYPKHEFTVEEDTKTLLDLGLFPSAVILVISKESGIKPTQIIANSGGLINIVSTIFWTILSPVFSVFGYLRNAISGGDRRAESGAQKRANEDTQPQNDASKRRNLERFMSGPSTSKDAELYSNDQSNEQQEKPLRRYGGSNIHRLSDKRKDSDDENATWNGNSTQQQ